MKDNLDEIPDIINLSILKNKEYGKDRLISKIIGFSPSNPTQLDAEGQKFWTDQYIGSEDILDKIKTLGDVREISREPVKGNNPTTRYYTINGDVKVGLLATYSWGYPCGKCYKLRVTPQGKLTICSSDDQTFNIKDTSFEEKRSLIASVLERRYTVIENKTERMQYRKKLGEFRFGVTEKEMSVEEFKRLLEKKNGEDESI